MGGSSLFTLYDQRVEKKKEKTGVTYKTLLASKTRLGPQVHVEIVF